jgi:NAD(P)-dependent dehydrogenase (short-subunit alcohol dehydrogenase family)
MAVLITGGTKGIGLAIARRFAKPGVDIFMAYRRDDASADSASAEIAALGARPHAISRTSARPQAPAPFWPRSARSSTGSML